MPFRRTTTIVTNTPVADDLKAIEQEADVIITATILGLSATIVSKSPSGIRFDIDPKDKDKSAGENSTEWKEFQRVVTKIDTATADYLKATKKEPAGKVHAGLSTNFKEGAVIMGVYTAAGQKAPVSITDPPISAKGKALYEAISGKLLKAEKENKPQSGGPAISQYTGRGAYTGFVDNPNGEPVGPRSTQRFLAPNPDLVPKDDPTMGNLYPRWLPPTTDTKTWAKRKRAFGQRQGTLVPWGLIKGDDAGELQKNSTENVADYTTSDMANLGMVFNGEPTLEDIAGYTHGLPQAIYKAYALGPKCVPYEIAVGEITTKMASCFMCTTFMTATGYPPTSIHLGRAESWVPLYVPENPTGRAEPNEVAVIRDLNQSWYDACKLYLNTGLAMLDDKHLKPDHKAARDNVIAFIAKNGTQTYKGFEATLILDALTYHKSESARVYDTLN